MPVLMILGTVGFMFGTGGTALVALTYGEGDREKANEYFSLLVYSAATLGIILALLGFGFIRDIAGMLGAKGELLENCVLYGRVILIGLPFYVLQVMFQSFFVAAEKPHMGFLVTLISGVTNMVLDAVLVIGFPQEIKLVGAAIATATAQFAGGMIPLIYFLRKNSSILRLGKTKFKGKVLIKATSNGLSEFMTNISMSIVAILFNAQLMKYSGENGVAAYGVMMYVSMIFTAVFVGFSIGAAPVISFHFGAKNTDELKNLIRKSILIVGTFGIIMVIAAEIFAGELAKIFVGYDEELYWITLSGFRIFALSFGFMGFGILTSGLFTALNDGLTSALISFLRTLVFESGAVMLLPLIFGIHGIWYSVVVSEFLALVLGAEKLPYIVGVELEKLAVNSTARARKSRLRLFR